MKSRPLFAIGLAAIAALSLSACGGGSSNSSQVGKDTKQTLKLFTDSDVNVQKLWNSTLIPAFEKAHSNVKLELTNADPSTDSTQLAKLASSAKSKREPAMDVVVDAGFLPDADSAGLLTKLSTSKIDDAPKTLADVLGWVKKNPGRFTYNSPSTGGAGQGFVQAALDSEMTAKQTQAFVSGYPSDKESAWDAGLAKLKKLTPSVYQKTYPNGNQAALNLLSSGSIDMTATWSDMYLSSIANGSLGKNIKAVSVSDPDLPGGVSSVAIAKNSRHQAAALELADWLLEPKQQAQIAEAISGYPVIKVSDLPKDEQTKFQNFDTEKLKPFYSAKSASDMSNAWQKQVP
jgi:putative spermidine/putrescine transport system substrate-binding protein